MINHTVDPHIPVLMVSAIQIVAHTPWKTVSHNPRGFPFSHDTGTHAQTKNNTTGGEQLYCIPGSNATRSNTASKRWLSILTTDVSSDFQPH